MEEISPRLQKYFDELHHQVQRYYTVAQAARAKGLDPEIEVNIPLANNMAERVVGLVSVVAPLLAKSALPTRIIELEKEQGRLDWRVGFRIAVEVANNKFCQFSTKEEAMEVGIRVGFAYLTLGIVSAPLEGFIGLKIKKRRDGKEYFALQYAGPIRGAGGTAAAISVVLADYVRVQMGYSPYDPDEVEVKRYVSEVHDYHEWVTNLQYHPSDEELQFMVRHLPVEVDGDPTEQREVSNYKDLPRIETNLIRGGVALVLAEGLCQKAPKMWKRLGKWGKEVGLEWSWLGEFISLKEKIHAQHSIKEQQQETAKVKPNNTYLMDLVAGRPILTHPLAQGGFRLRYGRTRATGFSAAALHPATMIALQKFIAIGTQLKVERPGKAATVTACDSLEGPIVLLEDSSVLLLQSEEDAKKCLSRIKEILYLGDILFNYGDFSENGQGLVPAGYCPEWWALEVAKARSSVKSSVPWEKPFLQRFLDDPFFAVPSWDEALRISAVLGVPLHPHYSYYWSSCSGKQLAFFFSWLKEGKLKREEQHIVKLIVPFINKDEHHLLAKRALELLGIPHTVANGEHVVIQEPEANILCRLLNIQSQQELSALSGIDEKEHNQDGLFIINSRSSLFQRDKAGTFIGARMGRPEKAKMRALTGSPQAMFPVGEEGDRLRSFQAAKEAGKVRSAFPCRYCPTCKKDMIYPRCEDCGGNTIQKYHCRFCGDLETETCRHGPANRFKSQDLDISSYFTKAVQRLRDSSYPDLIKGIRGTSNKDHVVEHLFKGVLRAKHQIYVNKDGTTRYDGTELPLTHFKPKEIKTSWEKLRALGYTHDIFGKKLESEEQLLELLPQDIILPGYNSLDESASQVLSRVAAFVDDLLELFYGLPPFYAIQKEEDLVGHLVIGLAPHISAGLIGRIIGFSETQTLICHPMYHAGMRRDCLGYGSYVPIFDGKSWSVRKIGEFVEEINPLRQVDLFGTKVKKVSEFFTLGFDEERKAVKMVPILEVSKHAVAPVIAVKIENGRDIETTPSHIFYIKQQDAIIQKKAAALVQGDKVIVPHNLSIIQKKKAVPLFIPNTYTANDLMISGIKKTMRSKIGGSKLSFRKRYDLKKYQLNNYLARERWPASLVRMVVGYIPRRAHVSIKRDTCLLPAEISLAPEVLWLVGLYIAEGCARKNQSKKGYYQISFAAQEEFIREKIRKTCFQRFNLRPSLVTPDALIYSSKLFYLFFAEFFPCGSKAKEKHIPPCFLNFPLNDLRYLLQGYFDGDGSTDAKELRVTCDTISRQLTEDLFFVLARFGIYFRKYTSTRKPGKIVQDFYRRKGRPIHSFTCTKLTIPSDYCALFSRKIGFSLPRKQRLLTANVRKRIIQGTKVSHDDQYTYLQVLSTENVGEKETYCLTVGGTGNFIANNLFVHNCDGDEAGVMLLMDALLNFSRQYLPERRGAKSVSPETIIYYRQGKGLTTANIGPLIDGLLKVHAAKVRREGDYEILSLQGLEAVSFDASSKKVGFYPITKFIRHNSPKELYKVTSSHGTIHVTGDHSVFVTTGMEIMEKEVRHLQKGDFIIALGTISLPEEKMPRIDLCSLLPQVFYAVMEDSLHHSLKNIPSSLKKKLVNTWGNNFYKFHAVGRRVPLSFLQEAGLAIKVTTVGSRSGLLMPRYITINSHLVRLIAYLISEGYLRPGKTGEIVNTNPAIVKKMKQALEHILSSPVKVSWDKRVHRKPCARLRLPAVLCKALVALGISPVRAKDKHFPSLIFSLPASLKKIFLDAYAEGDGHHYVKKNFTMLYSQSRYLAAELSLLAHSLGMKTSINKGTRCLQILISPYNSSDPWWPLQDFTTILHHALCAEGYAPQKVKALLANYYPKSRSKSASRFGLQRLRRLLKLPRHRQLNLLLAGLIHSHIRVERVREVIKYSSPHQYVYDLEVPHHQNFLCGPHPLFAHNTMDSPLVLTSILRPSEVDDQVHGMDVAWKYPLEFYEAALAMKKPWEVKSGKEGKKIEQLGDRLGTPLQYEGFGFTHPVSDINRAVQCSAYKILPSMEEKLIGQMDLAKKIRAVDMDDVARLVIQKHLLRDIKGNLRKFSMQQFRCAKCNEKFRRPPLLGKCTACGGRIIFTISEGSVIKYLGPSLKLAESYDFSPYLKQTLQVLKSQVEDIFGKEKEKQVGLAGFMEK